ncbi:hypothetical protein Sjap_011452 [Stephania japonica]|uniref:SHSP domain-containing protein n=1 Tax=Stephania japonica TaxID=461633 RepID=A0AAP0JDF5_9MAGN
MQTHCQALTTRQMSLKKQPLEVIKSEDHQSPKKWCISLMEDKFNSFISQGDHPLVHKVFGAGSLFSPFLFRKYFDPSDAFPLWEFGSDILSSSSSVQIGGRSAVEWLETDKEYVLKAELPGLNNKKQIHNVQVVVEKGKVVEISGQWRESEVKEWKSGHWWEHGCVRRLELPQDADWRKIEANIKDEVFLEIRVPEINNEDHSGISNIPRPPNDVPIKESHDHQLLVSTNANGHGVK